MGSRVAAWKRGLYLFVGMLLLTAALGSSLGAVAEEMSGSHTPGPLPATVAITAGPRTPQAADVTGIVFRVTIERVTATNNFDGDPFFDKADFFGRVRIDTVTQQSPVISNNNDIYPNWQFTSTAFMDDTLDDEVVTLSIGVWDADDFGNTNQADLTQTTFTRDLEVSVDVNLCLVEGTPGAISGNVSGACGQSIVSEGLLGPSLNNTARVQFRVEAMRPPSVPGLNVLCTHSPIWPQAGQTVTVSAQALADNMSPKFVSGVTVFLQETETATNNCVGTDTCSAEATATISGSTMFYGCQVRDVTGTIWSGWRRVQVGNPPAGQAAPVLYTGPSRSRVDIVFLADPDSYSSALDPLFLTDVHDAIRQAYFGAASVSTGGIPDADGAFGERFFLSNQDKFNFWIAQDTADIDNNVAGTNCTIALPGNWNHVYPFADSGAILHRDSLRDCAYPNQRVFGSEFDQFRTMLHETMHSPFGLADEYCCDSSYFQLDPLPNIYQRQETCSADSINLAEWDAIVGDPPRSAASCVQDANGWWKSEPPGNDIMTDNMEFNAADIRRAQYLFDLCTGAFCGEQDRTGARRPAGPEEPVPEVEYQTGDKVILLQGHFDSSTDLVIDNSVIIYGHPSLVEGGAPMVALVGFDKSDVPVDRWQAWHPLLKLGTFDRTGFPEGQGEYVHGPAVWSGQGPASFLIPFSPNLSTVTITDLLLELPLLTVDLQPVIDEFCEQHPDDTDCQIRAQGPNVLLMPAVHSN